MQEWKAATKEEVQAEIQAVAEDDPAIWAQSARHLLDPYQASIERFGKIEQVYVVATFPNRVVYFDDVEDEFATAAEVRGTLVDCRLCGELRWALADAERGD